MPCPVLAKERCRGKANMPFMSWMLLVIQGWTEFGIWGKFQCETFLKFGLQMKKKYREKYYHIEAQNWMNQWNLQTCIFWVAGWWKAQANALMCVKFHNMAVMVIANLVQLVGPAKYYFTSCTPQMAKWGLGVLNLPAILYAQRKPSLFSDIVI